MKYKYLFINIYMTYFSDNNVGSVRQHVTELCINNEYVISDDHYRQKLQNCKNPTTKLENNDCKVFLMFVIYHQMNVKI